MAKINKQEVIQKLVDELNLYPGKDLIPSELADKILAVYQINTQDITVSPTPSVPHDQTQNSGEGNATDTIYTTPAKGDYYVTGIHLSAFNSAAATCNILIQATIDGSTVILNRVYLAKGSTAAGDAQQHYDLSNLSLQNPVLIDPGTNIQVIRSSTEPGTQSVIFGYLKA